MKDKSMKQARHEYSPNQRLTFMLCLGPIFLFLLPYLFVSLGQAVDRWLGWAPVLNDPLNLIFGLLLTLPGLALALWTNYRQFTLGRGTPVPVMATQRLIVEPPYTYCRNPMVLGTVFVYLGVALMFHSLGAALVVLVFIAALLVYVKLAEEKEMEGRFGQEYLEYKRRTPFLIPRLGRK